MLRAVCCGLLVLLLCCATSLGCHVSDAASVTDCVRNILESSRTALKDKFDPLHLKNQGASDRKLSWLVTDIYIDGLSAFEIKHLSVRPSHSQIAIDFGISWPGVKGRAKAKIRVCKKIIFFRKCFSVRGNPEITLINPSASLATTLNVHFTGRKPTITPSKTDIQINLPRIHVKPRLGGFLGWVNRLFGNPARHFANKFASKFWRKNKKNIENKIEAKLNDLIIVHLSRKLPDVLTGLTG